MSNTESNFTYQKVVLEKEAHTELLKGATILANAVKSTMGPSGHSVIIDNPQGPPTITKDGVSVARAINLKERLPSMGAELLKEVASKTNELAGDGPQPTYAKVLTPRGWTTMGTLKVNDIICGTNGTVQTVLGIYQKGVKDIYKVTLADGNKDTRFVECSEEHLWDVRTSRGKHCVLPLKQMLDNGISRKGLYAAGKYFVQPTQVEFANANLPIDPYLLGVLLGDGSLSTYGDVEIAVGLKEDYILNNLKAVLPEGCKLRKQYYYDKKHYIRATITGCVRSGKSRNELKSNIKILMQELGLLGTNSHTKFIPKQFLYSTIQNRQKLLNGLIDTDGYINKRGLFEYSTVSEQLSCDFVELCRSLGKVVCVKKLSRKQGDGSFSSGSIFRISELKGNRFGLKIKSIEKLNKQTEMMCIKVSNDDHLYITDDYTPTHNTTTATVLAHSMLSSGIKMLSTGRSSIEMKAGMDEATRQVQTFLKATCIPVSGRNDIVNIGTISANGDSELGNIIADAIEKVGKDGIIAIEPSKTNKTTLSCVQGMQIGSGFLSPFFITNNDKANCEFENPMILITSNKISSLQDIVELLQKSSDEERPLLIICDDLEGEALHTCIVNKTKGVIQVCAVKAPSYSEHRADVLSDLATVLGAEVIGATSATSLKKVSDSQLGTCAKVVVNRSSTTFIGDPNDVVMKQKTEQLVSELRNVLYTDTTLNDLRISRYRERLARLSGGVAIIHVGGSTETEIKERKDRVEDAVNATTAATQDGIVSGGGTILYYAAHYLKSLIKDKTWETHSEDFISGVKIIITACEAPLRTIVENTGVSPDVIGQKLSDELMLVDIDRDHIARTMELSGTSKYDVNQFLQTRRLEFIKNNNRFGYNAATREFGDLVKTGIIDPVKVTRYALEHASSVVGLVLTCNAVIVNEQE